MLNLESNAWHLSDHPDNFSRWEDPPDTTKPLKVCCLLLKPLPAQQCGPLSRGPGQSCKGSYRGLKAGSDSLAQRVRGNVFHRGKNINEQVIPSTSSVENLARDPEFTDQSRGWEGDGKM